MYREDSLPVLTKTILILKIILVLHTYGRLDSPSFLCSP